MALGLLVAIGAPWRDHAAHGATATSSGVNNQASSSVEQVDERILTWLLTRRRSRETQPETWEEVFRELVAPIVQSSCQACHTTGGAAGHTRLRFVAGTERHHGAMNLRAFEEFLSRVGVASVLETIQDETHGGEAPGEGTDEFAAIARLLDLLAPYVAADDRTGVSVYRLFGENPFSLAGSSLAAAGDTNGDGLGELLVGSQNFENPRHPDWHSGKAYVISGRDLLAADRAHGPRNRAIHLGAIPSQRYSWAVVGQERSDDLVGSAVAPAGDHTGDGLNDVWLGARGRRDFAGEVYLVSPRLVGATRDRQLDLSQAAAYADGWVLTGEAPSDNAGRSIASADVDGDGFPDVLVGAPWHGGGAVYIASGKSLSAADVMDGEDDRHVGLEAVAAQANSWKLLAEGEADLLGIQLAATGDLDGDGRADFLVAATGPSRSAVYLVAAASLDAADAADGASDGVIQMRLLVDGVDSWKLVGRPGGYLEGRYLAANDLDGDGNAELLIGSHGQRGANAYAYVLATSGLPAADRADGSVDGVVDLERAVAQAGSYRLTGDVGSTLTVTSLDFDGDGSGDVVVGAPEWTGGAAFRPSPTEVYKPGAVYLISGTELTAAAGAGRTIDLERVSGLPKSWKVVGESGEATDLLGWPVSPAGDLNGDGVSELALGTSRQLLPYMVAGVGAGPGGVVVLSGKDLALADATDGTSDGVVHLNALGIAHAAEFETPAIVEQYDDHVVVMHVPVEWSRVNPARRDVLTRVFLAEYEDVFDYLLLVSNLPVSDERYRYSGRYQSLSNADQGVGVSSFDYMPSNRLRGLVHFTHLGAIDYAGAHELMHSWANFVIDAPNYGPHWGFSSANGQLGGFDPDDLVDLGDGRYAAGEFSPAANPLVPYGPLELYLAGWVPAEEVPDLWVARDVSWTGERDAGGGRVFSSSEPETWTVERLVEEYGMRVPSHEHAQRQFRAAAILLVDEEHPATEPVLAALAEEVRRFGLPGADDHEAVNFWEATGGRATIGLGDLSEARRDTSSVPRRNSHPLALRPDQTAAGQWRALYGAKLLCEGTESTVGHHHFHDTKSTALPWRVDDQPVPRVARPPR